MNGAKNHLEKNEDDKKSRSFYAGILSDICG